MSWKQVQRLTPCKIPTFCFLFVHCLNELKERLIVVWSNFRQFIIDTAIDRWRKRLQACVRANGGGHFEHLLWTNSCEQLAFFMCFWFKWLLSIVSAFNCVDAWCSIGLPCQLQSFKLVKDSEWTKSKMLIFCMVLIFNWFSWHSAFFVCWTDNKKSHLKHFYVHEKCKFLIFKFSKVMQQHI